MAPVVASRMSAAGGAAFDEGFVDAFAWSQALAGGAAMPQETASIQLGPGEVRTHALRPSVSPASSERTSSTDRPSS